MPQPGSGGPRDGNWPPGQHSAPRHPQQPDEYDEHQNGPQRPARYGRSPGGPGGPPGGPDGPGGPVPGPPPGGQPRPGGPGQAPPRPRFIPNDQHAPQFAARGPRSGPYPADPYEPQQFRNPRTGADYRRGDDFTMPAGPAPGWAPGTADGNAISPAGGYQIPPDVDDGMYILEPGTDGPGGGARGGQPPKSGRRFFRRKRGRIRRLLRLKTVRAILAALLIFLCLVGYSLGKALSANNGLSLSAKLAEWARDHYLGPVVTLIEQWSYTPPKTGGKPGFALTDPHGNTKFKKVHGFKPDIPANLQPFAAGTVPGEGVWHLQETVKGEPALYTTFMRVDAVHTSYVAAISSVDQRLARFGLHPGATDPGQGFGGGSDWVAPGHRTGLLATFNGGFRLNSSKGGFYLNGQTWGTLANGAASMVFYRDGTARIGVWGRDVRMTPDVVGVRQNLQLILDNGQVPASINQNVMSNWGATLGGAAYVWRSGVGITRDGRILYIYGPSLSAENLAKLLQRAGAVRAMELDINPEWTTFEYYRAAGHPADPTPVPMLPDQQSSPLRFYSPWARDFVTVYSR